jgi:alkyl hydroperoxide reductase subunit F
MNLDEALKSQLVELYAKLKSNIELRVYHSPHADQASLIELLEGVAATSPLINIGHASESSAIPSFDLYRDEKFTGVRFTGIPAGHEFSSFVLAILNADGQGKIPDEFLASKIKRLKGEVKLTTYISLTCETCPDVVQALNQMALIHPNFTHEMRDGAYFEKEIAELHIQGVPSIIHQGKLLHSGRITFLDLLK